MLQTDARRERAAVRSFWTCWESICISNWPTSTLSPSRTATASTFPVPGKLTSNSPLPTTRPMLLKVSWMLPTVTAA